VKLNPAPSCNSDFGLVKNGFMSVQCGDNKTTANTVTILLIIYCTTNKTTEVRIFNSTFVLTVLFYFNI